jgi:hypothetical protein
MLSFTGAKARRVLLAQFLRPIRSLDMHDTVRLTQAKMPDEVQLELLAPWYTQKSGESRTLDFFDAIPKYPFSVTTSITKAERIEASFTLHGKRYLAEILPAQIKDPATGEEKLVFAGAREELVERALRFIAVQQTAKTRITLDTNTGREAITVFFTLSMIRRHLEALGHGYKLREIQEALDVLSGTMIEISPAEGQEIAPQAGKKPSRRQRFVKATILSNYAGDFLEGDSTGEESRAAMTFHPLATQAILELAYYPINQTRVGSLKHPLARWLTTRMSHNYRQARKHGFVDNAGYHIALKTILEERGLTREARLRNNLDSVRKALQEMKQRRILSEIEAYKEELVHMPTKRRPKIVNAVWTLYPSTEFVEEIIGGNREMALLRAQSEENKRENQLLPGFQTEGRGK